MARSPKSRKSYSHPGTGQARKRNVALHIDRLGAEVKALIVSAREAGETWQRIAELASTAAGQRVPVTSLLRWYDLRVSQKKGTDSALREIIALLRSILQAVSK